MAGGGAWNGTAGVVKLAIGRIGEIEQLDLHCRSARTPFHLNENKGSNHARDNSSEKESKLDRARSYFPWERVGTEFPYLLN